MALTDTPRHITLLNTRDRDAPTTVNCAPCLKFGRRGGVAKFPKHRNTDLMAWQARHNSHGRGDK